MDRKTWIKVVSIVVVALLTCGAVYSRGVATSERAALHVEEEHPPLYLPQLHYVRLLSLGYDTILSRLIWFSSINYFGQRTFSHKDIPWMAHMCELTVSLDPEPVDPIEFCGAILPWMAKDPKSAEVILTQGMKRHPKYWRLPYMRGFIRWYFLEDMKAAQQDMIAASHTPDAPAFVQTLASRLMAQNQNGAVARQFLGQMIERTKDPEAKKVLEEQYRSATLAEHLEMLTTAVERYQAKFGKKAERLEDLVSGEILKTIPPDPYGGAYTLDPETGRPRSSSGKAPLKFAGKTAKTGIMAEEFGAPQGK